MTPEEAIQALNEIFDDSEFSRYESWYGTAMKMAIEALSATNLKEEFESAEYEDYEHATLVDIKEPLKVLVVRCKDCDNFDYAFNYCNFLDVGVEGEDFFCAYGERREE